MVANFFSRKNLVYTLSQQFLSILISRPDNQPIQYQGPYFVLWTMHAWFVQDRLGFKSSFPPFWPDIRPTHPVSCLASDQISSKFNIRAVLWTMQVRFVLDRFGFKTSFSTFLLNIQPTYPVSCYLDQISSQLNIRAVLCTVDNACLVCPG